jgi:uncharacterized hydrophobic protein (TIGR00271 family)
MILAPEKLTKTQKQATVNHLFEHSAPTWDFYLMLALSAATITFGLWENNSAVVIGGMLIAPMLYPIMSVSMGIVVGDGKLILRSLSVILKSVVGVIALSLGISLFFIDKTANAEMLTRTVPNISYFLIAIFSGIAMAYALARPNLSDVLPGVAINVALVPPLAVTGITFSSLQWPLVIKSLEMFFFNLTGIVFAALLVFAMMRFFETREVIERKLRAEEKIVAEENKEKQLKDLKQIKKTVREATSLLKKVENGQSNEDNPDRPRKKS